MRAFSVYFILLLPGTVLAETSPVERRLYPDKVTASTFLSNDWNRFEENYHPNYIGDDDPRTAWTEGAPGTGKGEWLRVDLTELDGATRVRLRLRNGYQKTKRLFERNARGKTVTVRLLPSGHETKVTLADAWGWQEVVAEQPAGKLAGVELRFDEVVAGTHYEDLCVSDVQVFVTATTPDNPSFEKKKRGQLIDWKKQRVSAAKLFKASAGKNVPLAPGYTVTPVGSDKKVDRWSECNTGDGLESDRCGARLALGLAEKAWPERKARLARARAAIDGTFASWRHTKVRSDDRREIPPVDGVRAHDEGYPFSSVDESAFETPEPGELGFLRADMLKRVQEDGNPVAVTDGLTGKLPGCKKKDRSTHYFWSPAVTDARPASELLVVTCGTYAEREGYYADQTWQLLVYDADGQLDLIVAPSYVIAMTWRGAASGSVLAAADRVNSENQGRQVFKETAPAAAPKQ